MAGRKRKPPSSNFTKGTHENNIHPPRLLLGGDYRRLDLPYCSRLHEGAMKGLKLIRRMEAAGALRYFPEEGKPKVTVQAGRLRRYWTEGVVRLGTWAGLYGYGSFKTPDDEYPIMVNNPEAMEKLKAALE